MKYSIPESPGLVQADPQPARLSSPPLRQVGERSGLQAMPTLRQSRDRGHDVYPVVPGAYVLGAYYSLPWSHPVC